MLFCLWGFACSFVSPVPLFTRQVGKPNSTANSIPYIYCKISTNDITNGESE